MQPPYSVVAETQ
jgi:hypothetical protein